MKWGNGLLDLAAQFQQADGIDTAWAVLKGGIGQFGATDGGYAFSWRESGGVEEALLHLDYPQGYIDCFNEAGHALNDFSIPYCKREPEAHILTPDERLLASLTPNELQAERDAYEFDVRHVVIMPLRGEGLGWGGWSACFRGSTRAEFDQTIAAHIDDIRRIGLMFHGAVRRQPGLGGLVELSPREREVLMWTAAGSSSKVIAHRLNLSTRTVEHHIAAAAKRLGAYNRTHAVAKALVLNLIQP